MHPRSRLPNTKAERAKRLGKKSLGLLSFGDEAAESEELLSSVAKKGVLHSPVIRDVYACAAHCVPSPTGSIKSSHVLLKNDPTLSAQAAVEVVPTPAPGLPQVLLYWMFVLHVVGDPALRMQSSRKPSAQVVPPSSDKLKASVANAGAGYVCSLFS